MLTATWQQGDPARRDLLLKRCIPSVAAQTIQVEHIVISDGPDPDLYAALEGQPVTFAAVPEHHDNPGTCSWAYNLGTELANTPYVGEVDDDNALRPEHCQLLADALDAHPEAAFAYSRIYRVGVGDEVGADPPRHGQIDGNALVWRRDTLRRFGGWPTNEARWPDWLMVREWMRRGAKWVHVPVVTVDWYYRPGTVSWRG